MVCISCLTPELPFLKLKEELTKTEKNLKELNLLNSSYLRPTKITKQKQELHSSMRTKKNITLFFFGLAHDFFDSFSYYRFFHFLQVLLFSERCSITTRGGNPPSI